MPFSRELRSAGAGCHVDGAAEKPVTSSRPRRTMVGRGCIAVALVACASVAAAQMSMSAEEEEMLAEMGVQGQPMGCASARTHAARAAATVPTGRACRVAQAEEPGAAGGADQG